MSNSIPRATTITAASPGSFQIPGDRLVAELERLGLRYLSRGAVPEPVAPLAHEVLIAGLASSPEARLQVALVPLFLWRPEYAAAALNVADQLCGQARVMLQCCYSAAAALQPRYVRRLKELGCLNAPLPDIFAAALDLPPMVDPASRLAAVAARHAQMSGEAINWLGTYEHAAKTFMRFAEPLPA